MSFAMNWTRNFYAPPSASPHFLISQTHLHFLPIPMKKRVNIRHGKTTIKFSFRETESSAESQGGAEEPASLGWKFTDGQEGGRAGDVIPESVL